MKILDILIDFYFLEIDLSSEKEVYYNFCNSLESMGILPKVKSVQTMGERIKEKEKRLKKVLSYVEDIKDPLTRELLKEKYIKNKTWEQVGERLGYTSTHTQRLNKKIVQGLKDVEI